MNVTVVGQGRVGLTAAVYLAEAGHRVTGVESEPATLGPLRHAAAPFQRGGTPHLSPRYLPGAEPDASM
jgi:glycine/D-amino acid oxidase-like deaminating enzyme